MQAQKSPRNLRATSRSHFSFKCGMFGRYSHRPVHSTYYDAENQAVDRINGDFYRYAHHVAAQTSGALQPHELLRAFVRYKHVDPYDPVLFDRTYEWMKARGLTEGGSGHAGLVAR